GSLPNFRRQRVEVMKRPGVSRSRPSDTSSLPEKTKRSEQEYTGNQSDGCKHARFGKGPCGADVATTVWLGRCRRSAVVAVRPSPMMGWRILRIAVEYWNSSHGELRVIPVSRPGFRCAHSTAMRPPVECADRTIRRPGCA